MYFPRSLATMRSMPIGWCPASSIAAHTPFTHRIAAWYSGVFGAANGVAPIAGIWNATAPPITAPASPMAALPHFTRLLPLVSPGRPGPDWSRATRSTATQAHRGTVDVRFLLLLAGRTGRVEPFG